MSKFPNSVVSNYKPHVSGRGMFALEISDSYYIKIL